MFQAIQSGKLVGISTAATLVIEMFAKRCGDSLGAAAEGIAWKRLARHEASVNVEQAMRERSESLRKRLYRLVRVSAPASSSLHSAAAAARVTF